MEGDSFFVSTKLMMRCTLEKRSVVPLSINSEIVVFVDSAWKLSI
jgi:hypothetical protein